MQFLAFWLIRSLAWLTTNSFSTLCYQSPQPSNCVFKGTKNNLLDILESNVIDQCQCMSYAIFIYSLKPFKNTQNINIDKEFFDAKNIDKL